MLSYEHIAPTSNPTEVLINGPTSVPTQNPTASPTLDPTPSPTQMPSESPLNAPTSSPTFSPSSSPSSSPSAAPSYSPSSDPTSEPTIEPTANPTLSPSSLPTDSVPIIVPPVTNNPTITEATSATLDSVENKVTEDKINNGDGNGFENILPFDVGNYLIVIILSVVLLCTCCIFFAVFIKVRAMKKSMQTATSTSKDAESEMVPKMHLREAIASQSIGQSIVLHSPSVTANAEPEILKMRSCSQMSAITPNGVLDILDDKFVEGSGDDHEDEDNNDDLYRKGSNVITSGATADDTDDTDDGEADLYSSQRKIMTPE